MFSVFGISCGVHMMFFFLIYLEYILDTVSFFYETMESLVKL